MAASSLLALIDDIATILDDVAILAKVAAKKTSGVLGDDLALNAQQLVGLKAERELPVVWSVAKGSLLNKAILVPAALLISAFAPWAITPLLMLGGLFLCFEGFEKIAHRFLHSRAEDHEHHAQHLNALIDPNVDLLQLERDKIKGAVRTDFILSAEIIAIALATVAGKSLLTQTLVLSVIALAITVGVYGIVAAIVKLDDLGLYLVGQPLASDNVNPPPSGLKQRLGHGILWFAPWLMKTLSVVGTAAMFLVGGGILSHGIAWLHHVQQEMAQGLSRLVTNSTWVETLAASLFDLLLGLLAGALTLLLVSGVKRLLAVRKPPGGRRSTVSE
jgi:uncharacterized protein